ncbi:MAG: aminopeptidase P N-terminal domain-containing protein, partial [Bacteroidota bacterium]|nr:aminopeptidase P N-terminal domain-containing protein [Bacteroidota bacterium]
MLKFIKYNLLFTFLLFNTIYGFSQKDTPTDYLSKEFHKQRRDALRKSMPANSVAVYFANPIKNRANDVDFHYHQDPDFFYLTGYKEPNSVLLIFSQEQKDAKNQPYNEVIFVQKRDPKMEQWNGRRLGTEGVKQQLGFNHAFEGKDFKNYNIAFSSFDKVLFFNFKTDVDDDKKDPADLYDLKNQFKEKIAYPTGSDGGKKIIYDLIQNNNTAENQDVAQ